jgi:hypothetical protein
VVRPAVRWGLAIPFWALIVAAIALNGALWPLNGAWPLALVAAALGLLALVGTGLLVSPSFRTRALLPGAPSEQLVGRLPVPVLISAVLFAYFLSEALHAGTR